MFLQATWCLDRVNKAPAFVAWKFVGKMFLWSRKSDFAFFFLFLCQIGVCGASFESLV